MTSRTRSRCCARSSKRRARARPPRRPAPPRPRGGHCPAPRPLSRATPGRRTRASRPPGRPPTRARKIAPGRCKAVSRCIWRSRSIQSSSRRPSRHWHDIGAPQTGDSPGGSMTATNALATLADQPALDAIAEPLSKAVRNAYQSAGSAGQHAKNAMHGVWLGHPLHPVFTDLPLGAWTTGLVLDAVAAANHDAGIARAADVAIAVGLAGAAGAAITGLTDWSETSGHSRRTGLLHGLLNIAATTLYATAYMLRRSGSRSSGQTFPLPRYGITTASPWSRP